MSKSSPMKFCSGCIKWKPVTEYTLHNRGYFQWGCRDCAKEKREKYYKANGATILARSKAKRVDERVSFLAFVARLMMQRQPHFQVIECKFGGSSSLCSYSPVAISFKRQCPQCGAIFITKIGQRKIRFCSPKCGTDSYRKHHERKCLQCEKTFKPKGHDSKFCSQKCFKASIQKYASTEETMVRHLLKRGTSLSPEDFPPEMVELKRLQLLLYRKTKQINK